TLILDPFMRLVRAAEDDGRRQGPALQHHDARDRHATPPPALSLLSRASRSKSDMSTLVNRGRQARNGSPDQLSTLQYIRAAVIKRNNAKKRRRATGERLCASRAPQGAAVVLSGVI